jgi:leucyl-tRNA synthetase
VTEDIENIRHNTAISSLMISLNELNNFDHIDKEIYEIYLKILSPFAPHMTEEIWLNILKNKKSIHIQDWPKYDENKIKENTVKIIVQINGKMRCQIEIEKDQEQDFVLNKVKNIEEIQKWLKDNEIKRIIYVKNKLINIVI